MCDRQKQRIKGTRNSNQLWWELGAGIQSASPALSTQEEDLCKGDPCVGRMGP